MIEKSRIESVARSYAITLGGTFLSALVLMVLVELLKQSIFQSLTLWESHFITIVVVALMSTAGAYIVFSSRESFYQKYLEEAQEHKGAEERLQLLAHTLRCITESVSITDMDDTIVFVNDAFTRIYGYTREEILGKPINLLRSSRNDSGRIRNILPATMAGGWNGELWNVRKDGTEFPAYLSTSIVRNDRDEPIALVGVAADITERKRVENAVIESEERYRRLVELSPEAVVVHSDRRFVYVNPAAVKMFGARMPEELIGKEIFDFVDRNYRAIVQERIDQITGTGTGVPLIEERFLRLDGTPFDVEVAAIPFTYKNIPSVQVVIRDISERKRTEAALRESEQRYRFLAENANDVIWMMNAGGKFTYVSPSVEKLRGFTPEEVLHQSLEEVLTPASLQLVKGFLEEASRRIALGERGFPPSVVEIEQPRKDGSTVWTEVLVNILFDEKGQFDCFLGVSRNISERKRAEQALLESEERFRNLAQNTQDVFWMVSPDYSKIIY
ncbi:MAG TPA: PAS domain S-box protein, partial [Bacteroidota bacterium]|nr:PAS domain S-box protein [Bacteroidota bacterium]